MKRIEPACIGRDMTPNVATPVEVMELEQVCQDCPLSEFRACEGQAQEHLVQHGYHPYGVWAGRWRGEDPEQPPIPEDTQTNPLRV